LKASQPAREPKLTPLKSFYFNLPTYFFQVAMINKFRDAETEVPMEPPGSHQFSNS
jgi:hypothetical protein